MKAVVQRSKESSVTVDDKVIGKIDRGLVVLLGVRDDDTVTDLEYIVKKVLNLRIFDDENGVMNKSILDVGGDILSISQFTLQADTKKGNRPSYVHAMRGEEAINLYNLFNEKLSEFVHVETGEFGAVPQQPGGDVCDGVGGRA